MWKSRKKYYRKKSKAQNGKIWAQAGHGVCFWLWTVGIHVFNGLL